MEHYFLGKVDSESKFFKQIFIFKEIEFEGRRVNTELLRGFSF